MIMITLNRDSLVTVLYEINYLLIIIMDTLFTSAVLTVTLECHLSLNFNIQLATYARSNQ